MEKEIEYSDEDLLFYENKNCKILLKYSATKEGIFNIDKLNPKSINYSITENETGNIIHIETLSHIKDIKTNS